MNPSAGSTRHASNVLKDYLHSLHNERRTIMMTTHDISLGLEMGGPGRYSGRGSVEVLGRSGDSGQGRAGGNLLSSHSGRFERFGREGDSLTANESSRPGLNSALKDPVSMPQYLNQIAAIVWKDFATELKTRELFSSMFVFALLVIIIFIFSIKPEHRQRQRRWAGGVVGVVFIRGDPGAEPVLHAGEGKRGVFKV